MIQVIVAIAVAIWFYRSARAVSKGGGTWALNGVVAVVGPSILWVIFVSLVPQLRAPGHREHLDRSIVITQIGDRDHLDRSS